MDDGSETIPEPQLPSPSPPQFDHGNASTLSETVHEDPQANMDISAGVVSSIEDIETSQQDDSTQHEQQPGRVPHINARKQSSESVSATTTTMHRAQSPSNNLAKSPEVIENDDVEMTDANLDRENCPLDDIVTSHEEPVECSLGMLHAADVVDLTLGDEGDDHDETRSQSDRHHPHLTPQVKPEPQDSERDDILMHRSVSRDLSGDNPHALPAVGNTEIPDEIENVFTESYDDTNIEITAASMANLLTQFNQNKEDTMPLPAEIDSDDEDIRARKSYENIKNKFRRLQCAGKATDADEVEFRRHTKEEDNRLRARKNRKAHEQDQAIQAIEDSHLFMSQNSRSSSPEVNDDEVLATSVYAALLQPDRSDQAAEDEVPAKKPRRGRPPKDSATKSNGSKKTGNSRISKKPPSGSTSVQRRKRRNEPATINTSNLLHHDIIAAANANQGQAAQPGFSSKNKKDALTELISSLPVDEQNLFAGDKADLEKASKNFNGRGTMKADGNGNWRLKGMKTSLRHYQLLGVSWMRSRENENSNPRGGILSDDMGLGKTVSAIANMVDGKPSSNYRGARATLLVVPPSLMIQWMGELDKHAERQVFKDVAIYRSKLKILDPVYTLGNYDIIITSYHEVARSLPVNNPPPNLCTTQAKTEWWENEIAEKKGPLHKIHWHRIILDEAQAIKNHMSKTSEAVCRLTSRYKWCLSGTPIQNSLEEFYPYFKFLKCANTGSFDLFKRNFTKNGSSKAIQRLQVYLGKIMLRRTHMDKLFGRPILSLPPIKPVETLPVKFNHVERSVYNIIKERFIKRINALTVKDTPEKHHNHIFVLVLRLRQLVAHPLLIQKTLKELVEVEDLQRLWDLSKTIVPTDTTLGHNTTDGSEELARALEIAIVTSKGKSSKKTTEADNDHCATFQKYLRSFNDSGNWAKVNQRSLCNACDSPASQPYITGCAHLYCLACLNELCYTDQKQGRQNANCLNCGAAIDLKQAFPASAFDEAGGRLTPDEDIDWYTLPGPMIRSAKVRGAVDKINEWFKQDPTNKIIVFTQFRGMIQVMERICREESGWGYATYHGEMTFEARDEQIKLFSAKPDCKILLASLRAGGVGLNLTAANRVIILDLWWNHSVEAQAFTRCFRIGQTRDVEVVRFYVEDSIDTQILHMQQRKIDEINKAMDDKKQPKKLTTQELLELFADNETRQKMKGESRERAEKGEEGDEDNDGNGADEPFIFPDDPYDQNDKDSDIEMIEID